MIVVLQRVARASVEVEGARIAAIGPGLLVLVGVEQGDTEREGMRMADKLAGLRIFEDEAGKMNRDLAAAGGAVLAVSQFTLAGDLRKGRRPSFDRAQGGEAARPLFEAFVARLRERGVETETGRFGAHMRVELVNDGPVTFVHRIEPEP